MGYRACHGDSGTTASPGTSPCFFAINIPSAKPMMPLTLPLSGLYEHIFASGSHVKIIIDTPTLNTTLPQVVCNARDG